MSRYLSYFIICLLLASLVTIARCEKKDEMVNKDKMEKNEKADKEKTMKMKGDDEMTKCEGYEYKGMCFWIFMTPSSDNVQYNNGTSKCGEKGGKPANMYDEDHYKMTIKTAREQIPEKMKFVSLWLGMKFDPMVEPKGNLTMSDGTPAPTIQWWYPGFPLSGETWSRYTQVGIVASKNETSFHQGLFAYPESMELLGVVCQM